MNSLQDYKRSGVDWIGNIPTSWNLLRGRFLFESKKEINRDLQCQNLLSLTLFGVLNKDYEATDGLRPENYNSYQIFQKDDLVFKMIDLENIKTSRVGIVHEEGIMSPVYIRHEPIKNKIDPRFAYWFYFDLYKKEIYNSIGSGVRSSLTSSDLLELELPVPPLEEQNRISRYLDKKTNQIDSLISKIEKKIELLKEQRTSLINQYVTKGVNPNVEMKDSGVEWIGEIPKHWEMRKITHITTLIGSGTTPKSDNEAYYLDGSINWLVTGDLNDGYVIQTSSKVTEKALKDYSSLKLYPTGSLLMAMYGATIGKLGILKVEATVNQATCVMNINENNSVEFWFNVLFGNRNYIVSLGYGGGQPNISQDLIKSLRFPCPPTKKEQLEIVEAIKSRIGKHDSVIQMEHKRLVLSKEYRQSLVSSVVTGKVRVTEEMI